MRTPGAMPARDRPAAANGGTPSAPRRLVARIVGWVAGAALLAAVFAAYLNPHLAVDLAARLWACF